LRRVEAGDFDAILLAAAGLNRLGLDLVVRERLDPVRFTPAPGQGALALQTRVEDAGAPWVAGLNHGPTALCVAAERGAMAALEGSCRTAIGAHATLTDGRLALAVEALSADGTGRWRRSATLDAPTARTARALGESLGREIRAEAGDRLIVACCAFGSPAPSRGPGPPPNGWPPWATRRWSPRCCGSSPWRRSSTSTGSRPWPSPAPMGWRPSPG